MDRKTTIRRQKVNNWRRNIITLTIITDSRDVVYVFLYIIRIICNEGGRKTRVCNSICMAL